PLPAALGPGAEQRRGQPVLAVHVIGDLADLAADEAVGERAAVVAGDLDHAAVVDGDGQAAQVRAVERACGRARLHRRDYTTRSSDRCRRIAPAQRAPLVAQLLGLRAHPAGFPSPREFSFLVPRSARTTGPKIDRTGRRSPRGVPSPREFSFLVPRSART